MQNLECLGSMRRPDLSVRVHWGTGSLARVCGLCSKGSWTTFPRLALWSTIFAADRLSASAVVFWPADAGGGFREGQPRHCPWDPTLTSFRLGESLWAIGMPNPFYHLGSSAVSHWNPGRGRDRWCVPTVPRRPAAKEPQRLSARFSQDGRITLRRRKNPRSLTSCCRPRRAWATACSSAPWTNSRCAAQACSPHQARTGWKCFVNSTVLPMQNCSTKKSHSREAATGCRTCKNLCRHRQNHCWNKPCSAGVHLTVHSVDRYVGVG